SDWGSKPKTASGAKPKVRAKGTVRCQSRGQRWRQHQKKGREPGIWNRVGKQELGVDWRMQGSGPGIPLVAQTNSCCYFLVYFMTQIYLGLDPEKDLGS
uniref:Uncharacterized protein n=1 Tax=Gopherus agassizii TaxID=38772 RepID=A0A452GVF3_9SAUR